MQKDQIGFTDNFINMNKKYETGRKVMVEPIRPFCTGGPSTITETSVRYNKITGKPFNVYKIDDKWWDEEGYCYDEPELMYYIDFLV